MGKAITYAELERKMHQIAHTLIELGVQKGDRVGIYMARSLETAAAMYGIMAAGAIYVPINPFQPVARTHFLLKDCGIKHLITNQLQKRSLPKVVSENTGLETIVGIDIELAIPTISWEKITNKPTSKPNISILEKDPAYILYTSGSTGTPKGIMHTHYSGLSYAKLSAEAYNLTDKDVLGNHAPIYFDISTFAYFCAPLVGATTIISSEAHIKMPASLSQLIEKEQVTVWYSVPLALIQMLQRGALDQRDMSALRWVLFAGEIFPTKHLRKLMQTWTNACFSNAYGPTETNVCTYYNLPNIPQNNAPISIGKAWGNTEILIKNNAEAPAVTSGTGELLIRSATLMVGYWNRPDLNEEAFYKRKNAFGEEEIFYKTGDLVKVEADGNLTFLGRKDRQVKTRGFRVELDEITTYLLQHEAVEEAAVYTVVDEEGHTLIEAAILTKKRTEEKEITQYLNEKLPWYALPQRVFIRAELPRTATGKIDLKQLKEVI